MSGCTIYSMESITIGRNTDIGSGCKIIDNDFHPLPYSECYPVERLDLLKKRPVVIGESCFLGANSIILKGTTLGKNVVVGAGSVVSGTFPDSCQRRSWRPINSKGPISRLQPMTGNLEAGVRFARLMFHFANIRRPYLDPLEYLCDVFRRIKKQQRTSWRIYSLINGIQQLLPFKGRLSCAFS